MDMCYLRSYIHYIAECNLVIIYLYLIYTYVYLATQCIYI